MTLVRNLVVLVWVLSLHSFPSIAEESKRLKRELRFPRGGSFVAGVALASVLPKGPTDGLVHVLEFDLGFPFPEKLAIDKKKAEKKTWGNFGKKTEVKSWYRGENKPAKKLRIKRDLKEEQKRNLLQKIEDGMTKIGFKGSSCASRFQCELRNISSKNSLLEELLMTMFKTSEPDDEECEAHNRSCPVSLLHVIMHSEQISSPHLI